MGGVASEARGVPPDVFTGGVVGLSRWGGEVVHQCFRGGVYSLLTSSSKGPMGGKRKQSSLERCLYSTGKPSCQRPAYRTRHVRGWGGPQVGQSCLETCLPRGVFVTEPRGTPAAEICGLFCGPCECARKASDDCLCLYPKTFFADMPPSCNRFEPMTLRGMNDGGKWCSTPLDKNGVIVYLVVKPAWQRDMTCVVVGMLLYVHTFCVFCESETRMSMSWIVISTLIVWGREVLWCGGLRKKVLVRFAVGGIFFVCLAGHRVFGDIGVVSESRRVCA